MQITAKSLLASFIALLLVLTLSPFVAYADETVLESTPQEYDVEIGPTLDSTSDPQKENSYRFENGERITSEDGAATDTESILSTFSAVVNPEVIPCSIGSISFLKAITREQMLTKA